VLGADAAFAAVRQIASAVTVPVTADLEAGYGLDAGELVERLLDAGAVGLNLEDTDHHHGGEKRQLVDIAIQVERIAAIKEAGRAAGVDIVLNARADSFLLGLDSAEAVAAAIERSRAYLGAGADCAYPIGAQREEDIRALVAGIGGPVNVYLRANGPDLATLGAIGVARASIGSGLFRLADRAVREAATALRAGDLSVLA
jgi:2-methylisocitrate lyase-like PEP mutase family enzyme